ncbi:MAG: RidA family protein [Planctomycetes bacterium]|nr:RidA family protein [Planctomycetota bacterium]
MKIENVEPSGWKSPKGYANGVVVSGAGRLLFVAGQIAWDAEQKLVGGDDMAAQFEQVLKNIVAVVSAAGGEPQHIVRMTCYVTDKTRYVAATRAIGAHWRAILGKHFPAMALVEVAGLLEPGALVEIEATAALP